MNGHFSACGILPKKAQPHLLGYLGDENINKKRDVKEERRKKN